LVIFDEVLIIDSEPGESVPEFRASSVGAYQADDTHLRAESGKVCCHIRGAAWGLKLR